MNKQELCNVAITATDKSYSPYSGCKVGAALLSADGQVFTGCNIENSAFSPTNCAERTAFFKAVSEGEREFVSIAIVGGRYESIADFCAPCGVCRQVMSEFCTKDFQIILYDGTQSKAYTLDELFPLRFELKND